MLFSFRFCSWLALKDKRGPSHTDKPNKMDSRLLEYDWVIMHCRKDQSARKFGSILGK